MTLPAPTYDLVLLLDPQAEPDIRERIVADARAAIESGGELLRHDGWGERALTYPIDKKPNAEYHLLQFHSGTSELLTGLDRTLRITDGVMRFRIIKLKPGVPDAPEMPAAAAVAVAPAPDAAAADEQPPASAEAEPQAPGVQEPAAPAAEEPVAVDAADSPADAPEASAADEPAVADPA